MLERPNNIQKHRKEPESKRERERENGVLAHSDGREFAKNLLLYPCFSHHPSFPVYSQPLGFVGPIDTRYGWCFPSLQSPPYSLRTGIVRGRTGIDPRPMPDRQAKTPVVLVLPYGFGFSPFSFTARKDESRPLQRLC